MISIFTHMSILCLHIWIYMSSDAMGYIIQIYILNNIYTRGIQPLNNTRWVVIDGAITVNK